MSLRGHVISSIYSSSKLKTKLEVISRYHEGSIINAALAKKVTCDAILLFFFIIILILTRTGLYISLTFLRRGSCFTEM